MEVNFNMHTHTYRCKHATGTDEEYVLSAIKGGIKTLGFSDHAFFPNIVHEGMRGDYSELDGYISSINELKRKYKKEVDIKLGFEIEYQEKFYSFYRFLLKEKGFDFLILGQHLTYDESGKPVYYFRKCNILEGIINYKNDLIEGMKTGLFLYVCHPDLFMNNVTQITPEIEQVCNEICEASVKFNIPLEINLGGVRQRQNKILFTDQVNCYPSDFFWKIASNYHVKCIVGIDAHEPKDLEDSKTIDYAIDFAKKYKLDLITDVKMINTNYLH